MSNARRGQERLAERIAGLRDQGKTADATGRSGTDREAMMMMKLLIVALASVTLATSALACPQGYRSCGETNQLCCPQ